MVRFPLLPTVLLVAAAAGLHPRVTAAPTPVPAAPPAAPGSPAVTALNPGEAEAQKCEDRIASVQRDVLNKYDSALQEMQLGLQKAADLEGALAARQERQRAAQSGTLAANHFVTEPKALRALQMQTVARLQELVSQVVDETIPRLVDFKKSLTVAGRLDEAVVVRSAIERLQGTFVPASPPAAGSLLQADVILRAYAADKGRADTMYKGQRLLVHGLVAGFRADPDGRHYLVYLAGTTPNGGLIQCSFPLSEVKFREDTQFGTPVLNASWTTKDGGSLKLQRGSAVDLWGQGSGFDETVRLNKCEFSR